MPHHSSYYHIAQHYCSDFLTACPIQLLNHTYYILSHKDACHVGGWDQNSKNRISLKGTILYSQSNYRLHVLIGYEWRLEYLCDCTNSNEINESMSCFQVEMSLLLIRGVSLSVYPLSLFCSELHFGASTRKYMVRERPQQNADLEDGGWNTQTKGNNFGLPEDESELEHLTEYNTAQNRIIDKAVVGTYVCELSSSPHI